jgi:ubiquinone/menaquinone biosynthesis C-methylase UbiE
MIEAAPSEREEGRVARLHDVCPPWFGYVLASPVRKLWQGPHKILAPYVTAGMTVLEPGPAMGFFTLELARMVGPAGRVVAVDLQAKMLEALRRRARKRGVEARIETRLATADGLGIADLKGRADFALLFAVVHELPDQDRFFGEVAAALKPGGRVLFAEPRSPVSEAGFAESLQLAAAHGLAVTGRPAIASSHAAVLAKT